MTLNMFVCDHVIQARVGLRGLGPKRPDIAVGPLGSSRKPKLYKSPPVWFEPNTGPFSKILVPTSPSFVYLSF